MQFIKNKAIKIGLLLESITHLFGARKKTSNDPRFLELAGFIYQARQLQTGFVDAESRLYHTKGLAGYETEDFLLKGSQPLLQRYSCAELMLRVLIALLEEGIHESREPIVPDSSSGSYIQSKLNEALVPFNFVVNPKKSRQ